VFQGSIGAGLLAQASDGGSGSALGFLLPLVVLGGLFYVFLVMPQRRRVKQMQTLVASLGPGDRVRTIGGIFATIVSEDEDRFVIDVGGGTTMTIAKRAVAERLEEAT